MEMGEYKHTTLGRIALLGDAVHKQTVSIGQGANLCVESAAVFTNTIKRLLSETDGRPSFNQIQFNLLEHYQNSRAARVSAYVDTANMHTELLCKASLPAKIMQNYVLPCFPADSLNNLFSDFEVGLDMLDFVPPPKAVLSGTMPLNKLVGLGRRESLLSRAKWALPLVGLFCFALAKMELGNAMAELEDVLRSGQITWGSGAHLQPLFHFFYGVEILDHLTQLTTTLFAGWELGFDVPGSWQAFTFLTDFGTLYALFLIESCRCANKLSLAELYVIPPTLCVEIGMLLNPLQANPLGSACTVSRHRPSRPTVLLLPLHRCADGQLQST